MRVSEDLTLPKESATWVYSFIAKRGAGKTYNAAVLAEEMLKAGIPIIVIDGMGTWWGLRVSADGEGMGLPILVFGGDHPDLPLVPEKVKDIAKAVVEANVSCVIDISLFAKHTARKIVAEFLDEVYKVNREIRHVFIEEADLWAPQRTIGPEQAICLGAVDNFVRRGGNRNLGCTLITQRTAVLSKDILTQSDALVVLRTLAPQDKKAIQLWVAEHSDVDEKKNAKWYDSLNTLGNGEAWVWHPEDPEIFKKVQFRKRETFHATREFLRGPQFGKIKLMPVDEFKERYRVALEPKPVAAKADDKQLIEKYRTKGKPEESDYEKGRTSALRASGFLPPPIAPPVIPTVQPMANDGGNNVPEKAPATTPTFAPKGDSSGSPDGEPRKETTVFGNITLKIMRLVLDNLETGILFAIKELGHESTPKEIMGVFVKYGWAITPPRFSEAAGRLVDQQLLQKKESGRYALTEGIGYQVEQVAAN